MPELPKISGDEAIRVFKILGFHQARQKGSHVIMRRGEKGCVFSIVSTLSVGMQLQTLQRRYMRSIRQLVMGDAGASSSCSHAGALEPLGCVTINVNINICRLIVEDCTMQIQTEKEKITKIIMSQPDDATYEEIIKELAFAKMVDRGLDDVRAGRIISNDEMAGRIRAWQK